MEPPTTPPPSPFTPPPSPSTTGVRRSAPTPPITRGRSSSTVSVGGSQPADLSASNAAESVFAAPPAIPAARANIRAVPRTSNPIRQFFNRLFMRKEQAQQKIAFFFSPPGMTREIRAAREANGDAKIFTNSDEARTYLARQPQGTFAFNLHLSQDGKVNTTMVTKGASDVTVQSVNLTTERLLNADTLIALSKLVDRSDAGETAKRQLELAEKSLRDGPRSGAALHLLSALSSMKRVMPAIPFISELHQLAKPLLIKELEVDRDIDLAKEVMKSVIDNYSMKPGNILRSVDDLHYIAAQVLKHNPNSEVARDFLANIGVYLDPKRTIKGDDVILAGRLLLELTETPANPLGHDPERITMLNNIVTVLEESKKASNNRDYLVGTIFVLGDYTALAKSHKKWPYQAKTNATALANNSIGLPVFKEFIQNKGLPTDDKSVLGYLENNIGLVSELLAQKRAQR